VNPGASGAPINAAGGQLPKTLPSPPTYRKVNPADAPIFGLAVHSDSLPITVVDDYAENVLVQHISQIPGVAQVNISGQQKPSVRIQVDPEELASIGLGLEDVRAALTTVTRRIAQKAASTPRRALSRSMPTISCSAPNRGTTSSSPTRRAPPCVSAISDTR
jgi:multidrug efflux pump subunit AcrB